MKRSHRMAWWTVYGVGSAAVLLALGWITARVVHLEHEEQQARGQVQLQEKVRLALWRMDSWLAPRLAREAGRTWFEYEPYYPQTMAYNRLLEPLTQGEVVLPSPLLQFNSEFLPLHFQYRERTGFTSPQVPSAVYLAQDFVGCAPVPDNPERSAELAIFAKQTPPQVLLSGLADAEASLANAMAESADPTVLTVAQSANSEPKAQVPEAQWRKMQQDAAYDLKARRDNTNYAQQMEVAPQQTAGAVGSAPAPASPERVQVGPLVPIWLGHPAERLVLARRVVLNSESLVQGVLVNWPALKQELLARAADVMPGADLRPSPVSGTLDPAVAMASLPVVLVVPESASSVDEGTQGSGLAGLGLVWLAALGALGTTGLALRSTIASAVQTSRFASSVTHELRTPLTTFRLYAEMLSDDMVKDGEQRKTYLNTLRDESGRLGLLVENVLTWSRVEEGRATVDARRIGASDLVMAAEPVLTRRCQESGAKFVVDLAAGSVDTASDADRIRQILFNLVDNACKYAGTGATVRLSSQVHAGTLILAVDDDGPGVPAHMRRKIFTAFDRGTRGPGDSVRGLGLGLAISRELARGLGGQLLCTTSAMGGARFELHLPVLA